ncbi:MAG: hypothetical protein HGA62_08970 [Chlorobiaceae bacterium]|jgi:magnesium transporter|nr:hypothetical protein [Chlorobiaceae bacterium]
MKVLTTIATIFMPLSFLAGVYGKNVTIIPGAGTPWVCCRMLGVMAVIFIGMVLCFRTWTWFQAPEPRTAMLQALYFFFCPVK